MSRMQARNTGTPDTNTPASSLPDGLTASHARQTHFWLTDEDILLTDDWAYKLRRNGWQRATRSACMRAMIQVLRNANIDLTGVTNEAMLVRAMEAALRHPDAPDQT